jgi:hypothetical protein
VSNHRAHANFLRQQAKKRVLTDGQGARKKKRGHRRQSNRHTRAFKGMRMAQPV